MQRQVSDKNPVKKHYHFTRHVVAILAGIIVLALLAIAVYDNELYHDICARQSRLSFSSQEILYLTNLRKALAFPAKSIDEISMKDMLRVLCKLNIRANYYEEIAANSTETLSDENNYQKKFPIILSKKTANIELPKIQNYQYEILNKGEKTVTGPILYQKHLWDTAEHLLESAGHLSIENELERARSLWRFVAENRYHFVPVTEESEEYDVIKYLSVYGYGFCDDTAGTLSKLAEMAGLRARTWVIGEGRHVVSEIYANGKWRMFDADRGICFYDKNSGELYGVEEICMLGNVPGEEIGFYTNGQTDILKPEEELSFYIKGRKRVWNNAAADHKIRYQLRTGEKIVFMNHNIGKYFLGKYPQNVPEYYNGFFEYHLNVADLKLVSGKIRAEETKDGIAIVNDSEEDGSIQVDFESPFPFVGGRISGTVRSEGDADLLLIDQANNTTHHHKLMPDLNLTTDAFFAVLTPSPTYAYSVLFRLKAKTSVLLSSFRVKTYFQFARMALLKLHEGQNTINIHFPDGKNTETEACVWTD